MGGDKVEGDGYSSEYSCHQGVLETVREDVKEIGKTEICL